MAVNKVEYNGNVLIDLTGDTITPDKLVKGITAHNSKGEAITGTHECSGGGSGTNNCEAYHITRTTDTISFNGSGIIKVWGYGYHSQSTYSKTVYAFVGDGYYTSSYYGTPSKTSKTWSLNSDGTLSGLPNLTSCDLLVEIGV